MQQRKKNILLLIVFILLTGGWIALYWVQHYAGSEESAESTTFAIQANAEELQKIVLESPKRHNVLEKQQGNWEVNNTYALDPSMQRIFMAILGRVRVERPVSEALNDKVVQQAKDTGVHVQIYASGEPEQSFYVAGDYQQQRTYFVKGNRAYVMHIPGYTSYLAGIFTVSQADWRDRTLTSTFWQAYKTIDLRFPGMAQNDFTISYNREGMFSLENTQAKQDTAKIMNWVQSMSYFYTDRYLDSAEAPHYAASYQAKPIAILSLQALDSTNDLTVYFYPKPDAGNFFPAKTGAGEKLLFHEKRIYEMLKKKDYFLRK